MRSAALRRSAAVAALLGVALAACGQEVEVSPAPPKLPRPKEAPPAGGTVQRDPLKQVASGTQRLTITVRDTGGEKFGYRAPRSVAGGLVDIRLLNRSKARRKAQLWRIAGDHSVDEALRAPRPRPDWLQIAGGVSYVLPGRTGRSLQALQGGRYYVANEAGEPGAVAAFTVTAPPQEPAPPRAPARVETRDYSFRVSGLRAGRNTIDLDNVGAQPHHAFFAPLRKGADIGQVRKFFSETQSVGPPPVDSDGTVETAVLGGGQRQVVQLDLRAGRYALICFVTNNGTGPQHIELGMINEVRVK